MKWRATLLLLSAALLLCPAASPQKTKPGPPVFAKSFTQPKPRVWKAMMGALVAADLFPQESDSDACTMALRDQAVETMRWGDANKAVAHFTTKKVTSLSTWQMLNVSGTLECKPAENGAIEVRIEFQFQGNNTVSARFENLTSRGVLEEEILRGVESRLTEPRAKSAEKKTP